VSRLGSLPGGPAECTPELRVLEERFDGGAEIVGGVGSRDDAGAVVQQVGPSG
jgi:hypothetical protein